MSKKDGLGAGDWVEIRSLLDFNCLLRIMKKNCRDPESSKIGNSRVPSLGAVKRGNGCHHRSKQIGEVFCSKVFDPAHLLCFMYAH